MHARRSIFMRMMLGTLLGAGFGACLPSMPEGERDVQCWTDLSEARSECVTDLYSCLDRVVPTDPDGFERCVETSNDCTDDALYLHGQCEWRSGCLASLDDCRERCGLQNDPSGAGSCQLDCELDFERCAPWYRPDCELECAETSGFCLALAQEAFEQVRCEDERLDCVLECY